MTARHDRMRSLVEENASDLLHYFTRRVALPEDAADLVGETMLTVWRRVADLPRDDVKARMWMFGVARKVLSNHQRGRQRSVALAERLRDELRVAVPQPSGVLDVIETLPETQRELILLVHGDGFSITDAAKLTHTNPSTARTRYATALASLREALIKTDH
ncbi:hypothetical protein GCM10025867_19410 [Frondihabitans sucicola]|uniref:Sigma-70 family RNA polymerase sigma factor n=1 Tax=Frondihabitans sucicola TaxID=1268041 RepID=A0ABM8GMP5_9MICO|nr:sigma-70 family RNA polymerase sigma factor [Frondihabitans sucicola]BDZ49700.1 hypothetical protein GCM10025867_19410 [Frondihabitans sucicola]